MYIVFRVMLHTFNLQYVMVSDRILSIYIYIYVITLVFDMGIRYCDWI